MEGHVALCRYVCVNVSRVLLAPLPLRLTGGFFIFEVLGLYVLHVHPDHAECHISLCEILI